MGGKPVSRNEFCLESEYSIGNEIITQLVIVLEAFELETGQALCQAVYRLSNGFTYGFSPRVEEHVYV